MKTLTATFKGIALITVLLVTAFFLLVIYLIVSSYLPATLSFQTSQRATQDLTSYYIPDSAKLVYSKQYWKEYWNSPPDPSTICTVFKFSDSSFTDFMNNDFPKMGDNISKLQVNELSFAQINGNVL